MGRNLNLLKQLQKAQLLANNTLINAKAALEEFLCVLPLFIIPLGATISQILARLRKDASSQDFAHFSISYIKVDYFQYLAQLC